MEARLPIPADPPTFAARTMTFFADLTTHTYSTNVEEQGVLNVGWLGERNPIPTGKTSWKFRNLLKQLCSKPILFHRGVHRCEYCTGCVRASGNGQIRVRDRTGIWYSAPTLILHYVTEHDYLPPRQFIDAVLDPLEIAADSD